MALAEGRRSAEQLKTCKNSHRAKSLAENERIHTIFLKISKKISKTEKYS